MSLRVPAIEAALLHARYADAMREMVALQWEPVDRFFADVMVMVDDQALRERRLALLGTLKRQILQFVEPSEIFPDEKQA